jgi:cyanuric acid amidohydrolase
MAMTRCAAVHCVPMRHPGDTSAIEALFDAGTLDPAAVVAVLGKTEGNGCVNDFTRAYAVQAPPWPKPASRTRTRSITCR